MFNKKRILALIPARGGSKRLPRKNALPFVGKPLIAWTIKAAKESNYVDNVVVSTDDYELAEIAKKYNASVPFIRPAELATDEASTHSVILHALEKLDDTAQFDLVLILQPSSPLRTAKHIDGSIEYYFRKEAKAVLSVCECDHNPLWVNTLPDNMSLDVFIKPEIIGIRSQDLPKYYKLNGAIYLFDIKQYIHSKGNMYGPNSFAYEMEGNSSIDIDTKIDFQLASLILQETDN